MNIKSIETKYVTEQPFKGLVEIEGGFEPYYATIIRYIDPREGERPDRVYSVSGQGTSEYESEQAALENLCGQMAAKVYSAHEKFMADNGAGNLDIA